MNPRLSFTLTVLIQIGCASIVYLCLDRLNHPLLLILCDSTLAYFAARWLHLSRPWQLLNLILPLGIVLTIITNPPTWLPIAILLLLALIYLPTFWTHVPYYPTNLEMYKVVAARLPCDSSFLFVDLGCGFGGLLSYLSHSFPKGNFVGYEISPLPLFISKLKAVKRGNLKIVGKNFWHQSLSEFDFVYTFLAPPPMAKVWEKVRAEMKDGSIFMTNSFPVPVPADEEESLEGSRQSKLYIHLIKHSTKQGGRENAPRQAQRARQ